MRSGELTGRLSGRGRKQSAIFPSHCLRNSRDDQAVRTDYRGAIRTR